MQHHNPYSGKRKGEHYVKLTQVEKDSLERTAAIVADISDSRHTNEDLAATCIQIAADVSSLLRKVNDSNEISLLTDAADKALAESKQPKEKPPRTRGK